MLKSVVKEEQTAETGENSLKPTSYTFYLKQKEVRQLSPCDGPGKPLFHATLKASRKFSREHLRVGQAVALHPHNEEAHVDKCIRAFGWQRQALIGNFTVKELLTTQVDMVSSPINLLKLFPETDEAGLKMVKEMQSRHDPFMTLLELADEFDALGDSSRLCLPQYMIEEAHLIPRIKPRLYSIINDPYSPDSDKADEVEILFSSEQFTKNGKV